MTRSIATVIIRIVMRRHLWLCGILCALPIAYGAANEVCSEAELRDAMALGGTINFGCGTQIVLSATLQARTNMVINANGHDVTISGGGAVRVFEVADGVSFTMTGLRIVNGLHKGADGVRDLGNGATPGEAGRGGALAATNATIKLESCVFSNNVARGGVAEIFDGQVRAPAGEAFGGAVFSRSSTLEIIGSEFRTNRTEPGGYVGSFFPEVVPMVDAAGGAIYVHEGTLSLEQSMVKENHSVGAGGGVAVVDASFVADQCEFEKNEVRARSADRFGPATHGDGKGGALHLNNSEGVIALSTFSANSLNGGGGYHSGGGALTGGAIYADKDLMINTSLFQSNSVAAWSSVNPATNSAGGALWVGGTAWISESRFIRNNVTAPDAFGNNVGDSGLPGDGFGGGIFVGGSLMMNRSSCISNIVKGGIQKLFIEQPFGTPRLAQGGAISASNAMLTNVTIAFNQVVRASNFGGALFLGGAGVETSESAISFCTLSTNLLISVSVTDGTETKTFSQLQIVEGGSSAAIYGSILSGGTNGTVMGTIVDEGYNISSDSPFTHTTSKNATDAELGAIGVYGGSTETIPVLAESPAVDAVLSGIIPNTDQRGRTRPYGLGADVGAYELSVPFFVKGRIQRGLNFGDVTVTASGANLIVDESTGAFSGDFTTAGSLMPTMAGVVFFPEQVSLVSGVEVFDAWFVGYIENKVAVEHNNEEEGITVTFAAESAGEYVLQSSSDLIDWHDVETKTITAHALFRKEVTATGSNLFYRVMGL